MRVLLLLGIIHKNHQILRHYPERLKLSNNEILRYADEQSMKCTSPLQPGVSGDLHILLRSRLRVSFASQCKTCTNFADEMFFKPFEKTSD
jgi:hypothetical protein